MNIQDSTNELHRFFGLFNDHFFANKLPEPAITIQTKGKRKCFGWCSLEERWKNKDESIKKYEINLTAEDLNRESSEIVETLLHEMLHLYASVNGIKDCSRGGNFHNKRFKEIAEEFGFHYREPADKKYGWAFPVLNSDTIELIRCWDMVEKSFEIARYIPEKAKKKSNTYKLECPVCGIKLRASKAGIAVLCKMCEVELIEY